MCFENVSVFESFTQRILPTLEHYLEREWRFGHLVFVSIVLYHRNNNLVLAGLLNQICAFSYQQELGLLVRQPSNINLKRST